ncbi:unnamed protein product [Urochloa humidicola]
MPSIRRSATAATDAGDREDNDTELLEGEDTAAVDEAEPRAQPAQLQPDTATSSPCTTRPRHRTHGFRRTRTTSTTSTTLERRIRTILQVSTPILIL